MKARENNEAKNMFFCNGKIDIHAFKNVDRLAIHHLDRDHENRAWSNRVVAHRGRHVEYHGHDLPGRHYKTKRMRAKSLGKK
jgi:hypothetical protein